MASTGSMLRRALILMAIMATITAYGQTPQPFPKPPATPQKSPASPPSGTTPPAVPAPTEALLGVPIYPAAEFITSYDAGRGQRFYLFGTAANYTEIVNYYRTQLKQKGTELFDAPPTHQFETGRFREEAMAFPPSVTVKDFAFGGSAGYPNPKGKPERFPTLIQIVPVPPGTPREQ